MNCISFGGCQCPPHLDLDEGVKADPDIGPDADEEDGGSTRLNVNFLHCCHLPSFLPSRPGCVYGSWCCCHFHW